MADDLRTGWAESMADKTEADDGKQTCGSAGQTGSAGLADSGIFRHGYGLIPKYAMQDRELPLTAKAIYAYLCSLCGGGETAFPGVDTIRAALGLGKDAYYQHRKKLEEAGYITVQRRHRGRTFTSNLYTLNANPKRFQQEPRGEWENRIFAAVRFRGLRGAGYGVLPRAVMTDPRLDAKAKALYAYFASFTGAGESAFPSLKRILLDLGLSAPSYYKYLNQLKGAGFLTAVQRKNGTRFAVNEYYLLDGTERINQEAETKPKQESAECCGDTAGGAPFERNPDMIKPFVKNPDIIKPDAIKPDKENPDTTNNTFLTNNKKHTRNKFSVIHLSSDTPHGREYSGESGEMDGWGREKEDSLSQYNRKLEQNRRNNRDNTRYSGIDSTTDSAAEKEQYIRELKQSCGYDDLRVMYPGSDMGLIDNLLSLMASAVCDGTGPTVRIGKREAGREEARNRFLTLTGEHLRYVVQSVRDRGGEVRNLRAYYLAALWNAPDTMELYYQQQVERDLREERRTSWGSGWGWD